MLTKLDIVDKNLLNIIQAEFPLSSEPFAALGQMLDIKGNEAISRIAKLKSKGIIRLIGPVLDARRIGYQTTLVAMKVRPEMLDKTAKVITMHPLVSHCYQRNHDFNFWFTLAMPIETDIEREIKKLSDTIKADAIMNLPAVRVFKIRSYFSLDRDSLQRTDTNVDSDAAPDGGSNLSHTDRSIINELQQDLPLTSRPFDLMSNKVSMDIDEFLDYCRSLIRSKVIRRYSASIRHTDLGFIANAMSCWKVSSDMVETVGKKMATYQQISHCYERKRNSAWPYNIFAMMHAKNKETCQALARCICAETELDQSSFVLLFSTKEIKKTRVRYQL